MSSLPAYANNQQSFPVIYERVLVGPMFRPWGELLLDRLRPASGERLLDVACGTGIVARLARARVGASGAVVGVDLSPDMLAVATAAAPDIEWRAGSALDLPLGDGERFDVATCQQGFQFFADRAAAAGQLRRATAPGGRIGVSTWRSVAEHPTFAALQAVAERHLGPIVDQRHTFGDGAELAALLAAAGFEDVDVTTVTQRHRFDDGAMFVRLNGMALVGMSAAGKTMTDEERKAAATAIAADSASVLAAMSDGPAAVLELSSNVAVARG